MTKKTAQKKFEVISTPMRAPFCSICGKARPIVELAAYSKYSGLQLAYYGECQTRDCAHGWHTFVEDFYPQTMIEVVKMFFKSKKVCKGCGKVIYV